MRRILCVILLGGLLLTMLSGCTSQGMPSGWEAELAAVLWLA